MLTTYEAAREALQRLIDCAFANPGKKAPVFRIPAAKDDDDILLSDVLKEWRDMKAAGTVADERAATVNHLRERANLIRELHEQSTAAYVLYAEADAIEAGRHRGTR